MLFKKDRKRRVIVNDDAYQQYEHLQPIYNVTDKQSFLDVRTTPVFDTHVDTYVWCVGNGCEPPWGPAWSLKHRGRICPALGSSARATDIIVEACHSRGMEVWGSLRVNDLHDYACDLEETNDSLKAQHPEYLIGRTEDRDLPMELIERFLRTAFNFERAEVRQHRLDFIKRNASTHDFDGYELDFTRFIWSLPQGRERELAPVLTDFVREVRSVLNAIGNERGRPYTLAVHVMDSVETLLLLGADVETWLSDGLVDVLIAGMGFMPFTLRLDEWQALGERYRVPIYPSLNTRPLVRLDRERTHRRSAWHEYSRAASAWWWSNGADGIYFFNLFTQEDCWGLEKELTYAPLKEIGDPTALDGKDKLYGIEPLEAAGMFSQASEATQLPIPLDIHERRLALAVGPDADDPGARFKILAWTSGGTTDTKVWMRLNHTLLSPAWQDDHYSVDVPAGLVRAGCNELAIWCSAELGKTGNPVIVHEVLTSVNY